MNQSLKDAFVFSHRTYSRYILIFAFSLFITVSLSIGLVNFGFAQDNIDEVGKNIYNTYLPVTRLAGISHYVSPSGNDTNPGTIYLPWRTINKAAKMVEPGETIYIRGGVYKESVHFDNSGTASSPIKILAYPGENPIIDGEYSIPGQGSALLWIVGDYIYASGLEIRNSAYFGITIRGNNDVVENMFVHHSISHGIIITDGNYSTVQKSSIWRNSLENEFGQSSDWGAGISAIRNNVKYATIRNNVVWENWGEGITSSSADHTVIEDNISHDNYGPNIYITSSTNVLCQRNFVYTNPISYVFPYGSHGGIMMGDESYDPPTANVKIINNIAFGNQGNFWWWQGSQGGGMVNVVIANNTFVNGIGDLNRGRGGVIISSGDHQNSYFINNIIQQDGDLPVIATVNQPGIAYSNNLWSKTPYSWASGPGDIIANPLFSESGDRYSPEWYKLTGVSPAINGAITLSDVAVDYFSFPREATPDIGANEFFPVP